MPISSSCSTLKRAPLLGLLAVWLLAMANPAQGQLAEGNDRLTPPRSYLDDPFESLVFLTGHGSYGGDYQGLGADFGYGGSLIFRPGSSVNLFSSLFRWNVATVLQVDHQRLDQGGSWTSADIIVRSHFKNRGNSGTEVNLFLGVGTGGSKRVPEDGHWDEGENYWTWLVEGGQEWFFKPNFLLLIKGQYRWFMVDDHVDGMWSAQLGFGIRWP